MKHIAEIGINHLGSKNLLKKYLNYLDKLKIYGVTLQITDQMFFKRKYKRLFINYNEAANIFFSNIKNKKVGLVTDKLELIKRFKNKSNFFKILSKDFNNHKLIKAAINTKKKTYVSTGMANYNDIKKFNKKYKKYKNLILIHTQLSNDIKYASLESIHIMKNITSFKIAYGFHSNNKNTVFCSLPYKPEAIFCYIKDNKDRKYPDKLHAYKLSEYKALIEKINLLKDCILDTKKKFNNWR